MVNCQRRGREKRERGTMKQKEKEREKGENIGEIDWLIGWCSEPMSARRAILLNEFYVQNVPQKDRNMTKNQRYATKNVHTGTQKEDKDLTVLMLRHRA